MWSKTLSRFRNSDDVADLQGGRSLDANEFRGNEKNVKRTRKKQELKYFIIWLCSADKKELEE